MQTRLLISILLTGVILSAFAADYPSAEQRVRFAGRWKLDQSASRSDELNRIMELYGLNWFQRWAANYGPIEQVMTWKGSNRVEVILDTPVSEAVTTFIFDRKWREEVDPVGKPVLRSSWWNAQSNTVMTKLRFPPDSETPDEMTIRRRVNDAGDTFYMDSIYRAHGSTNTILATRVFRRKETK